MNKLKEEFLKFLDYEMPVSTDKQLFSIDKNGVERLYNWINQNYISKEKYKGIGKINYLKGYEQGESESKIKHFVEYKQQILNLECLKEEKTYTYFSSPLLDIDVRDITTGKITHWRKDKKYKHQSILSEEQILKNQLRKEIKEEIKKL